MNTTRTQAAIIATLTLTIGATLIGGFAAVINHQGARAEARIASAAATAVASTQAVHVERLVIIGKRQAV